MLLLSKQKTACQNCRYELSESECFPDYAICELCHTYWKPKGNTFVAVSREELIKEIPVAVERQDTLVTRARKRVQYLEKLYETI